MKKLGKWLLESFGLAADAMTIFSHRIPDAQPEPANRSLSNEMNYLRTDWIGSENRPVAKDLFGDPVPLNAPAHTRLIIDLNPANLPTLQELADNAGMPLDELPMESVAFMTWAVNMVREGRQIASLTTHEGTFIIARNPQDGTYIKADMQAFRNAVANAPKLPQLAR